MGGGLVSRPRRRRPQSRVRAQALADVVCTPTRDCATVLRVPFDDYAFDRRVDDLLVAIALTTEQHRCAW